MNEPWIAPVYRQLLEQQRSAHRRLKDIAEHIADTESQCFPAPQLPTLYLQYERTKSLRDECVAAINALKSTPTPH